MIILLPLGRSVIDTAKAISAIRNTSFDNKDDLRDIIVEERYNHHNNFIPIMAIPTHLEQAQK